MSKVRFILKNPLVATLPLIVILLVAWQHYTLAISTINTPTSNILFNSGFDTLDNDGFPSGWLLTKGDNSVSFSMRDGYQSPRLLELDSSTNATINTTLASPNIDVSSGHTYFYKGFYNSTLPFDLLLKTTHTDGTTQLNIVGHYSASSDWTTASDAITADDKTSSVQLVYSFASKGKLQLDNNYIEQDPQDVYIAPQVDSTTNLIPNPGLSTDDGIMPNGWDTISNGNNKSVFSYVSSGEKYLQSNVSNYKDGEAKWRYNPIVASAGHLYRFKVNYRSSTPADVVAEYAMATGDIRYETLETLKPSSDWTSIMPLETEAPIGSKSIFVTVVQHGNGYVDTKDYQLTDTTKSGAATWDKPYVSFTFDDGWSSPYDGAVAMLDQLSYKATFYVIPSSIDTRGFMSSSQLAALKKDGHELASHGYTELDFTTLPGSEINYQMEHSFQYFNQVHNENNVDFASPFGSTDAQLVYYARKYYRSLRGTDDGINTKQNFNPYNLKALYVGNNTPASKIAKALDEAKATNGWLILIYHQISSGTPKDDETISPAQFQQQLATVKKSGIAVQPVSDVFNEINGK